MTNWRDIPQDLEDMKEDLIDRLSHIPTTYGELSASQIRSGPFDEALAELQKEGLIEAVKTVEYTLTPAGQEYKDE